MITTESCIHLLTAVMTATTLIFTCWATAYCMGLNQRLEQNKANNSGPTTLSEAIAVRIVLSLFRRAHLSGWRESLRRSLSQCILGQMRLENLAWERDLSDGMTRFTWKVRMPVLYSTMMLPAQRRIEVLVPLKGATDDDLKNFNPSEDS